MAISANHAPCFWLSGHRARLISLALLWDQGPPHNYIGLRAYFDRLPALAYTSSEITPESAQNIGSSACARQ
jgi:hypothetical protein